MLASKLRIRSTSMASASGPILHASSRAAPMSLRSPSRSLLGAQARTFWWWTRQGSDWSSYLDEAFQKRVERQQKMMRYKYSKALRRRALWEHDSSENCIRPVRGWRAHSHWMNGRWVEVDELWSERATQRDGQPERGEKAETTKGAKADEPQVNESDTFARWKASIDKDPFGAVFGRRLETSSASPQNSSWTSSSWIFDPSLSSSETGQQSSHQEKPSTLTSAQPPSPMTPGMPPAPTLNGEKTSQEEEYEFDPISMRKVLKSKPLLAVEAEIKRPLFDRLFAEPGVDIPVKTYKPHKVFGHGGTAKVDPAKKPEAPNPKISKKGFESSRLRELQKLKAATIGNSIDTTAEYFGKWSSADDNPSVEKRVESQKDTASGVPTDPPPFSGTTYESKSNSITGAKRPPGKEWLIKEGFSTPSGSITTVTSPNQMTTGTPDPSEPHSKVQPALDRMQATTTSCDSPRISPRHVLESHSTESKTEDLDLLRASDLRASFKSGRKTKQDVERSKKEDRQKLEEDYTSRQNETYDDKSRIAFPDAIIAGTQRLSETLNNLWHRVRQQPKELVASTIRSLSVYQDSNSISKALDVATPATAESLALKEVTPSKVSLESKQSVHHTPRHTVNFTLCKEVVDAERESENRTKALRAERAKANKRDSDRHNQAGLLAKEIRKAYESLYGSVDVNHRQGKLAIGTSSKGTSNQPTDGSAQQGKEFSVSDEMARRLVADPIYPVLLSVRAPFRSEIIRILREMKSNRRVIHEATLQIRALKSRRPLTQWNAQASETSEQELQLATAGSKIDMNTEKQSSPAAEETVPQTPTSDSEPKMPNTSGTIATPTHPPTATPTATPTITPSQQTPTLYKILAYDSSTLQITEANTTSSSYASSSMNNDSDTPLHPTDVLSRLNNPAKFLPYFQKLQDQGFEIVKGGGDMLVFKKVRDGETTAETAIPTVQQGMKEDTPLVDTPEPAEPDVAMDPALPASPVASAGTAGSKVRRQEDVFSGSGQTWHQEKVAPQASGSTSSTAGKSESRWFRFKKGVQRVVLTGLATAGICYAIGAVAESFGAQQPAIAQEGTRKARPGIYSTESSR